MKYTHRLNAFTATTTWSVGAQGLSWSDDKGKSGNIAWNKIQSVRLRHEPSRAETRRIVMHVYTPIDHPISNIHFKSIMNFKLQKNEFRDFVLAFHQAFPKDTKTLFYKGSTRGAYIANVIITLAVLAFLFLLAPLLALTGIPSAGSIVRIGIIILFVPLLLSLLSKNKPDVYDLETLPLEMLE